MSAPIAWLIAPFAFWAFLGCTAVAAASGAKSLLALAQDRSRHVQHSAAWLLGAVPFYWFWRLSGDPVTLVRGSIPLSFGGIATCVGLIAATWLAMRALARFGEGRRWPRTLSAHLSLGIGSVLFGLPFVWLLLTSFKDETELGNLGWVPHVQVTAPYSDPANPLYETTYDGTRVEVQILNKVGDRGHFEVQKPESLHGLTYDGDFSSLKEIPRDTPIVHGLYQGREITGQVVQEMEDGSRRVHVISPEALRGQEISFHAADVAPVMRVGLRWANYSDALDALPRETNRGLLYLRNTLVLVALNVLGTLLSSAAIAYAFARIRFPGRQALFFLMLCTLMLPGAVTLMPSFLIYRSLGWIDTLLPLWVPAFFGSAFNVFLFRQFFLSIPAEFEDSAKIDGCSHPRIFWSVMLPQIKPALTAVALWTFMSTWGDFMRPLIYVSSPENMPISYATQLFSGDKVAEPGLLMAFATMGILPVILIFLFAQRYFVESFTLSGFSAS